MPKKNGITRTYSFTKLTLHQIDELGKFFMLKPTNLLEFLLNEKYKEVFKKWQEENQN